MSERVRWAGWRLIDSFMLVLLIAGALKIADIVQFQDAVKTWPFIPHRASLAVALGVANLEIAIALGWFLKLFRRIAFAAAVTGLLASIAVFATFIGATEVPDCGCFGLLAAHYGRVDSAEGIVLRNGGFLAILVVGGILAILRRSPSASAGGPRRAVAGGARAFTVIEVLVTMALVTVLVSLVSPLLGDGRKVAQRAVSLSNLRQHASVFASYAIDYDGQFPYFVHRDAQAVVRCGGAAIIIDHWSSYATWNLALANGYYNGNCRDDSFYPPEYPRGLGEYAVRAGISPYYYGCAFIARPVYWNSATRLGPSQWGSTRQASVLFPAKKGLLFAYYPLRLELRPGMENLSRLVVPTAFVDAHAEPIRLGEIRRGYSRGDGQFGGGSHHFMDWPMGLHTIDGVRGRDID